MRHGIERHRVRQIGQPGMHAVLLVHRHLVIFQGVVHVFALEPLLEYPMAEQIFVAHPIGRDRLIGRENRRPRHVAGRSWQASTVQAVSCNDNPRRQWPAQANSLVLFDKTPRRARSASPPDPPPSPSAHKPTTPNREPTQKPVVAYRCTLAEEVTSGLFSFCGEIARGPSLGVRFLSLGHWAGLLVILLPI